MEEEETSASGSAAPAVLPPDLEKQIRAVVDKSLRQLEENNRCLGLYREYRQLTVEQVLMLSYGVYEDDLNEIRGRNELQFADLLREARDSKQLTDVDLYKAAGLSKQAYSKVISGKCVPSRETVITLCVALGMNIYESNALLKTAGYCFLPSDALSMLARNSIKMKQNLEELNTLLDDAGLPVLGSK
ncbi:MAG: helix-turn-helix transcriptional regulator [Treponema sp.]|nr:helix-turn-helix transcriptional regulator [Treponema sp.]